VKNPWFYIFLRLAAFGAPLAILLILRFDPYYSVAVATAIGLTISIVWLSKSREELSKTLYEKYNAKTDAEKAEDIDD
jgi:hypothetical protein